jgi:hypothetical protein
MDNAARGRVHGAGWGMPEMETMLTTKAGAFIFQRW